MIACWDAMGERSSSFGNDIEERLLPTTVKDFQERNMTTLDLMIDFTTAISRLMMRPFPNMDTASSMSEFVDEKTAVDLRQFVTQYQLVHDDFSLCPLWCASALEGARYFLWASSAAPQIYICNPAVHPPHRCGQLFFPGPGAPGIQKTKGFALQQNWMVPPFYFPSHLARCRGRT